jgi:hypothetical protein
MKFALGQPVPRTEDPRLLTGPGRYTDDFVLPRPAHAVVLRSPHAHARIRSVDIRGAQQMPGVLAVLTGEDWAAEKFGARVGEDGRDLDIDSRRRVGAGEAAQMHRRRDDWIVTTALGYFLWNKVLAMMSPVMAGQVLTLTPICGFFLSMMIFGGAITVDVVASILLIAIGLVLTPAQAFATRGAL